MVCPPHHGGARGSSRGRGAESRGRTRPSGPLRGRAATVPVVNERPRHVTGRTRAPPPPRRSIQLEAITDGASHSAVGTWSILEDFDGTLDLWGPAIVREDKGSFVTYVEESRMAIRGGRWDIYAAAGSLVDRGSRVDFALSRRHVALALGPFRHFDGGVCSLYNGAVATTADDGLMLWTIGLLAGGTHRIAIERKFDAVTLRRLIESLAC